MQIQKRSRVYIIVLAALLLIGGIWIVANMTSSEGSATSERPVEIVMPMLAFPTHGELTEGFIRGMEELGYKEGKDVVYRTVEEPITPNPEGMEQIRNALRSHIENDVDLIVVLTNPDASIALEETAKAGKNIPIVGLDLFDPVEKGLVEQFEEPGVNLTGVAEKRSDSVGRFLDIFTTIVPGIETMGVLTEGFMIPSPIAPATDFYNALLQQTETFGIELVEYTIDTSEPEREVTDELARILSNVEEGEVDSWVHMPGHFVHDQQAYEHEMGLRANIPVAMPATIEINPGSDEIAGLFAYGANFTQKGIQGAAMTDKILRGTDPSRLPIEFPVAYDLIINARVAEEIGVEIPQEVLEFADEVIE